MLLYVGTHSFALSQTSVSHIAFNVLSVQMRLSRRVSCCWATSVTRRDSTWEYGVKKKRNENELLF